MNPKISIIVPVYKVEQYIEKCIQSILAQTFKDFELILIDDGSPDKCGEICDSYAKKDSRIKVIHKSNGGQASARNLGIDIAKGDYIGFVDSDDYIEPDMYSILYDICKSQNCDIANCSSIIHYKDNIVKNGGHSLIIHNRNEAMKAIVEGILYDEVVWSKLFKRELLNDIRFPEGIMYEDTAFMYKVIDKCTKVCCIGEAKYNYIKRDGSTMDRATKNLSIDSVLVYNEMYSFISKNYPELSELVLLRLVNNAMLVLNLILNSNEGLKKNRENYYTVIKILNKQFSKSIKIKNYPITVKILLIMTKLHPKLYKYIINISDYRRIK